MLADKDRVFTNLYGEHDWHLPGARRRGDWSGTREVIAKGRDWIVNEIKESGLRGRGGAGFPTGIKWKTVLDAAADQKYVCCNADEGDSGTFADRMLMEGDPFTLIEA